MKQRMQGAIMGALTMVLLLGAVTVHAAATRSITVEYGNIRTAINGQEFVVRNSSGLVMESFIYNGEVYIPLASVLHAMGDGLQWDNDTRTVNFAEMQGEGINVVQADWGVFDVWGIMNFALDNGQWVNAIFDLSTGLDGSGSVLDEDWEAVQGFNITGPGQGITMAQPTAPVQRQGVPFWTTTPPFEGNRIQTRQVNMLGQPFAEAIIATSAGGWSNHNLNGQFRTLTGTLGRIDGGVGEIDVSGNTPIISFIGDGRELASFSVDRGTVPHEISVDLTGVNILQIRITQPWLVMGGATPVNPALANVLLH